MMFWRDLKSTNWTNVPRKVSQEIPWSNGLKAVLIRTLAKRFGLIYIGAGELLREAGVGGPSDTEWRLSSFHQSLMEAWPIGVGNSIKSDACSMHVTDARSWSWLQILWFWFSPYSPLPDPFCWVVGDPWFVYSLYGLTWYARTTLPS